MEDILYQHSRIDRARLLELNQRSDSRALMQLAGHGAAILATGLVLSRSIGSWWVVPATVLHGAVLVFLFAPLHETIHRTAFKSRWLNDGLAWLFGLLLLLPPEYFRFFHFAHHRHTQDPQRDPELARAKPATRSQWLLHVSGWYYWRAGIVGLVTHALGRTPEPFLAAPRAAARIVTESRVVLAIYALVAAVAAAAGSWAPLTYWLIPVLVGQPFLRLYLFAEHTGCPLVPDMLANSRTTLTNAIVRFFTWNMPYHAEHHAFPSVPFHALPALHRDLRPDLQVVAPGYVAVNREILRAL
jgi:fatty acid desaturase